MTTAQDSPEAAPAPVVIEPHGGWPSVNWAELWSKRELLFFLTWRNVRVRYKQTVLGALWALLQPFLAMVVLTIVFNNLLGLGGRLMGDAAPDTPYPLFLFAGLLPWQFFSKAVQRSSASVVADAPLVGRVYFPRLVLPMASVGAALIDFALSFLILIGLMVYYGVAPSAGLLVVVPLSAATAAVALGVGSLLGALNAAYRDLRHIVPFLLQLWFYATPLLWALSKVPDRLRPIAALNPMCGIVEACRWAIVPGWPFPGRALAISLLVCVVLFAIGLRCFRRIERDLADII